MSVHPPVFFNMFSLQRSRVMSFDKRMTASSITTSHDANNNTRSNSTNDDIITAQNRAAQSVCRRLFEGEEDIPSVEEQRKFNQTYLDAKIATICQEKSQEWNFDFNSGLPHSPKKGQKFTWLAPDEELPTNSTNSSTTISSTTVIPTTQKQPTVVKTRQQLLTSKLPFLLSSFVLQLNLAFVTKGQRFSQRLSLCACLKRSFYVILFSCNLVLCAWG